MEKKKILAIIIFIVLIFSLIIPTFSYAISEKQNELNENENNVNVNEEIINDKNIVDNDDEKSSIVNNIQNNVNIDNSEEKENIIKDNNNLTTNENIENVIKSVGNKDVVNEEFSLYIQDGENIINLYNKKENIYYLFVPKHIDLSEMVIKYTGNIETVKNHNVNKEEKQIEGPFQDEENFTITLADNQVCTITILQSDLPSVSIKLDSDVSLETVNNNSKDIKYGSSIDITDNLGDKSNIKGISAEFKGRGNYTWTLSKKAYQIKFDKKQSVLGMSKAKTWILLANHTDNSFMRNQISFDFARELGLDYTPNYKFVDLWVNGDYIGNYMVVEKIQVNENRVNLVNDFGVISELDNLYYMDEKNWFRSTISRTKFTLKDSVADDEDDENSVSVQAFEQFENDINTFESALYSENKDWETITSIFDIDSLIKFYFVQELAENSDGCKSSMYMYKDGPDDKIHMGPVWDFDIAYANFTDEAHGGNPRYDYIINIKNFFSTSNNWYSELFKIKEFRQAVSDLYNTDIKFILEDLIDNLEFNLSKSAYMNNIIWDTLGKKSDFSRLNKNTYEGECEYLKDWLQKRVAYLDERYRKDLQIVNVNYQTHVELYGWQNWKHDGKMSGTEGESKRLEAIRINLDSFNDLPEDANIKYQVHVQEIGWQDWKNEDELAGTEGQSKRLEAIRIKLDGLEGFSVRYRVHIQEIGWQDWKYDGEMAGTTGQSKRLEAIEIQIFKNNPDNLDLENILKYNGHVQTLGNTDYVSNGEIVGTTGRSLRLEGIKIELDNELLPNTSLQIDTHIQDIGWINNLTDKDYIGTQGRSLRMEGLRIRLVGEKAEKYNIKYRVHVEEIGWQDWKYNGEMAGTEGQSRRIEAIQIMIF